MKLTVLGCWAPYPRAGGACSGYLLEEDGTNILIDCGNGSFANLQKHLDFRKLDAVIVSHLHADHHLDLFCLVHAIRGSQRDGSRAKPLDVFMPESPQGAFNQLSKYKKEFNIKNYEKIPLKGQIGPLTVEFFKTSHPIPTYAVNLTGSSKFSYSADTAWDEGMAEFVSGANLFLCEASLIEEDIEYTKVGHMTAAQAGTIGRLAGADKIVLTHLYPEYDLQLIENQGSAGFNGPVQIAKEGETYLI